MGTIRKKILVVDDDPDILEIMTIVLRSANYEVLAVDNGHHVADLVQQFAPNVILLDVMLGDLDGRDICKALKNTPQTANLPVIIVSATHGLHTAHEKRCGADQYISKPFDIAHLKQQVHQFAM
ncbi:response regulator [Mucilaginibacter daejeonensis]|uniref:response regulator n=1 Tax=Mucilaginibacter daejeonensis TaxID=398049 RepID=UPI001D17B3ED|nr:response regulator [Mucilaginibacter daejeonensis]UEG52489.1 response regulator [Mucilaginibacter daejeonensis]